MDARFACGSMVLFIFMYKKIYFVNFLYIKKGSSALPEAKYSFASETA